MSRGLKTTIAILAALVVVGLITLPSLRQAIKRVQGNPRTEQEARREVMQVPISTPTDVQVQAQMFWLSASSPAALEATPVQLPLSADPVERSKQLLIALIVKAPAPERRTLAADATLLAFYIQPDGTGIADFSDELSSGTPSGILSEQLAVDSITQTLGANVPGIRQLKILIHGQEADTLAGHVDLTGLLPFLSLLRRILRPRLRRLLRLRERLDLRATPPKLPLRLQTLRRQRRNRNIDPVISSDRLTAKQVKVKLKFMSRGGNLRSDGRAHDQMRPVKMTPDFITSAEGSVLIEIGNTRVICTATVDDGVPSFLKGQGKGWVTGEYGMLPRATEQRTARESTRGRPSGRTLEIQRLIGRSLRAIVDQQKLGERTVWLDCDVIQADGGTRTASITGAYVALALAMERMVAAGILKTIPLIDSVAAISVGLVGDAALLDLAYEEDSRAEVDMNVVMTGGGKFVEVQATAEGQPFAGAQLQDLLALAATGIRRVTESQSTLVQTDFRVRAK